MAASLGNAVFKVDLDTTGIKAQFEYIKKLASTAGKRIRTKLRAEKGTLAGLDLRINSLKNEIRLVQIGTKKYKELAAQIRKATRERGKQDAAMAGGGGGALGQLKGVAAGAVSVAALTAALSGSIAKALELETATRMLSDTLGAGGAAESLKLTKNLANELGLSFLGTTKDFAKFTAAATAAKVPLADQKGLFIEVTKAAVRYGLSNEQIGGTFIALQQMASKGVVSMEELRNQLGERLPVAFAVAADGLGVTTTELNKLVESGELSATKFFPAFTKGLKEIAKGSDASKTSAQKLQKFTNKWEDLQIALGKTAMPTVIKLAEGIGDAFDWAAKNLSTLISVAAGLAAATLAFKAIAAATWVAANAQNALAIAASVAQVILNPAGAAQVAAALAVGAGVAISLKVALDDAAKSQTGLGDATGDTKRKLNELDVEAKKANEARIREIKKIAFEKESDAKREMANLQFQEARLGNYAKEVGLVQEIAAVRSDAAIDRSGTIKSLLGQEMAQAQKLATSEIQRKQIALKFGRKIFNQTVMEFDLKARALVSEQTAQRTSLQFEQQKTAAAGKRAEKEAKIAEIQAQSAFDQDDSEPNKLKLDLAKENLKLIKEQNEETQSLGQLQLGLLSTQQAAGRERLSQERLLSLNSQKQFATVGQQAVIQRNVSEMLRGQAQQVDAAAVSAQNFKSQLEGASQARGNLSAAFQAQVNTHLDGSQHFSQMNSTLETIATNTGRETPITVNVSVDPVSGAANSSVSGTG